MCKEIKKKPNEGWRILHGFLVKSMDNRITPKIKVIGCGDAGCGFAESIAARGIPDDILVYAVHSNEGSLLRSSIPRKILIDLEPSDEQVEGMKKLFGKKDIAFILSSKDRDKLSNLVIDFAHAKEKVTLAIYLIARLPKVEEIKYQFNERRDAVTFFFPSGNNKRENFIKESAEILGNFYNMTNLPAKVWLDLDDIKRFFSHRKFAMAFFGNADGETKGRAMRVVEDVMGSSPFIPTACDIAMSTLVWCKGDDMSDINEIEDLVCEISERVNPNSAFMWGYRVIPEMGGIDVMVVMAW